MIKKDEYEKIAACIQGDQMSAPEIAELFEDSKFLKWYREGYQEWKGKSKKERCPHN